MIYFVLIIINLIIINILLDLIITIIIIILIIGIVIITLLLKQIYSDPKKDFSKKFQKFALFNLPF